MADTIPALRLTDPAKRDRVPSFPTSPVLTTNTNSGSSRGAPRHISQPLHDTQSLEPGTANKPRLPSQTIHSTASPDPHFDRAPSNPTRQSNVSSPIGDSPAPSPVDPLSQQILDRARPASSDGHSQSRAGSVQDDRDSSASLQDGSRPSTSENPSIPLTKTWRSIKAQGKGVSFLTRIINSAKRKPTDQPDSDDDASSQISDSAFEPGEARTNANASLLSSLSSYNLLPPYVKIRAKHQRKKEFDKLFLAQEMRHADSSESATGNMHTDQGGSTSRTPMATPPLNGSFPRYTHSEKPQLRKRSAETGQEDSSNTIWAMKWSIDGKYLATAGNDSSIRIWSVLTSPGARQHNHDEPQHDTASIGSGSRSGQATHTSKINATVFDNEPYKVLHGHEAAILDLSWSRNGFLLSSAMDKTVRLWHISRPIPLCTFKHNDFVTSIAFHPQDDRFFLAGSLDKRLRLWSIPEKSVTCWNELGDMVTAVSFTPDGKGAIAGCANGRCSFYETEGLKYQTQLLARGSKSKSASGAKITAISTLQAPSGEVKVLVTSNDSRVRLYNFRDKALEIKLRGGSNNYSQIRAAFSDDLRHVCSGSEDGRACVWPIHSPDDEDRPEKWPIESFDAATDNVVTCVSFAPTATRRLLERSEDPIYDLCNSSSAALTGSSGAKTSMRSRASHHDEPARNPSESFETDKKTSPHRDGHIIVTADFTGKIKVFRQDCAWRNRRSLEAADTSSRRGASSTHRMRQKGSMRSLRSGKDSTFSRHGHSDLVSSWRHGLHGSTKRDDDTPVASPSAASSQTSLPTNSSSGSPVRAAVADSSASRPSISDDDKTPQAPKLSATKSNPLMLQGEQSNLFWDVESRRKEAERIMAHATVAPVREGEERAATPKFLDVVGLAVGASQSERLRLERSESLVSRLTIESTSGGEGGKDGTKNTDAGGDKGKKLSIP